MEEGREMSCDAVTKALSDGDGRVTRRRDVRAHLRSCAHCRGFRDEMEGRQHDLAALSPLPAIAAAGMLQGLVGGSGAATGGGLAAALGGGAAKTIATSAAVKGVATVAVVAAVGVTAADRTGVIHVGLPGEGDSKSTKTAPGAAGSDPRSPTHPGSAHGFGGNDGHGKANAAAGHRGAGAGTGAPAAGKTGTAHSKGHGKGHGKAHGGLQTPASPSEHATGKPETTPSAGQPEATSKPTHPAAPPPSGAPPKEAPENPPAAAPEPPQQAPPPQSQSSQSKVGGEGPGASENHGKAPEKTS
jgi:hypothetical protein